MGLRARQVPRLLPYTYACEDYSLTSYYLLKPFYSNVVLPLVPHGMAPNAITLSGFAFVLANIATLLVWAPTLDGDCPPWVYASWGIGLFLYQTFDAIDGAQARRTHQSGPLGELFDHGVDALNTGAEVLIFAASQNFGMGWKTVLILFASLLTFYTQTWEEYETKQLTLGLVNGPVEGILILCLVYLFTAYVNGASFWSQSMLAVFGVPPSALIPDIICNLSFSDWYMVQGSVVLVFNTIQSIQNVIAARRARSAPVLPGLAGLLPFVVTWTLIPIYLHLHPTILAEHLVAFVCLATLINAYSVGSMITAHLARLPFPFINPIIAPLGLAVVDALLSRFVGPKAVTGLSGNKGIIADLVGEVPWLWGMLGLALGVYGSWVVDVIANICEFLDIWCLSIKHKWDEGSQEYVGRDPKKQAELDAHNETGKKDL